MCFSLCPLLLVLPLGIILLLASGLGGAKGTCLRSYRGLCPEVCHLHMALSRLSASLLQPTCILASL